MKPTDRFCQCCGEALLPTARALVCSACHHSANIRHCRVYCTLHNQELDPTARAPLARATARVVTRRPLRFHTRDDIHTHRDLAECEVCRDA